MESIKICISVDSKLYFAFKEKYPRTLRQAVEVLMRRSICDDSFLWNFIYGDLSTISVFKDFVNEKRN